MTAPRLELAGVRRRFGRSEIIAGVDLVVEPGERHALIGPNGAGKSTLFNLISGRVRPDAGSIRLDGRELAGLAPYRVQRLGLGRSFQITSLFPRLSVLDNLRCAALHGLGHRYEVLRRLSRLDDVQTRSEALLRDLDLVGRRDTAAADLSYAEQRALEIGIAVAGKPTILLLDEPTAGMSRAESERAVDLIRRLSAGRTLVMVEHDMSVVFGLAQRISVLVQGRVLATDTPERIRHHAAVQEAYLGGPAPGKSPGKSPGKAPGGSRGLASDEAADEAADASAPARGGRRDGQR